MRLFHDIVALNGCHAVTKFGSPRWGLSLLLDPRLNELFCLSMNYFLERISSRAMNLFQFILVAFSALSLAIAQSHGLIGPAALEVRAGHRRRLRHDHDVRPDFRQPCICGPDSCPLFLNKKSVSSYLEIDDSLSDISL